MLGVRVDCLDALAALHRIEAMLDQGGHHQVVTVNPEFVMRAQNDREFARVIEQAALCLADGVGVVWAMRRQGCRLQHPVTGSDLVAPLAELCQRRGRRLFLLGAKPGIAPAVAGLLRARFPSLEVAAHGGSPGPADDEETLHLIHEHRTDALLVAYGAPQQDLWIDRLKGQLGVSVAIGVGGAFDFVAGRVPRAPEWMRRAGLEWLHRLVRQPWRIKRMAVLPVYAFKVLGAGRADQ